MMISLNGCWTGEKSESERDTSEQEIRWISEADAGDADAEPEREGEILGEAGENIAASLGHDKLAGVCNDLLKYIPIYLDIPSKERHKIERVNRN